MTIDREPLSQALGAERLKLVDGHGITVPRSKYIDKGLMYKGKDGHDYPTSEALFEANRSWMGVNYPKLPRSKFQTIV